MGIFGKFDLPEIPPTKPGHSPFGKLALLHQRRGLGAKVSVRNCMICCGLATKSSCIGTADIAYFKISLKLPIKKAARLKALAAFGEWRLKPGIKPSRYPI